MGTTIPWFEAYLVFSVVHQVFIRYLDYRQIKHIKKRELPSQLRGVVGDDEFNKSVSYSLDKLRFGMLRGVLSFTIQMILLILYMYPVCWRLSGHLSVRWLEYRTEYTQSLIFCGILMVFDRITGWPFDIYRDFVIEARHGFNKKTMWIFITDEIKSIILTLLLGTPILCLVIWVIRWGGKTFYFWLWGVTMALSFIMMTIYPNFIAPLFNKFEELKDTSLKEKIEAMARKIKYPLKRIYQMDESKRSAHSNAYLYGFGNNKRIVLFDTLLEMSHERILAIVGHELGHWKLSHTIKNIVFGCAHTFFMFYLFGLVFYNREIYVSFGYASEELPVLIGLFIFSSIYEPVTLVVEMISTSLSRRYEFQAAKAIKSNNSHSGGDLLEEFGYAEELQDALLETQKKNLSAYSIDPVYEWFHYTHPHLVRRLDALKRLAKKSE